jgi:hypothetical protein
VAKIPIIFSRIILLVNDPLCVTRAFTFQRPVLLEYVPSDREFESGIEKEKNIGLTRSWTFENSSLETIENEM